jgi:hypothetical protein
MSIVLIGVGGRERRRLRRLDHVRYASRLARAILVERRAQSLNQAVEPTMEIAIEDISMSARITLTGMNRLESVTTLEETMIGTGMREGPPATMMRGKGEGPQVDEIALTATNRPEKNITGTRAGKPVGTEVVDAGNESGKQ